MRPIDADALLAEYDRVHEGPPGRARKLIEQAPTIESEIISKVMTDLSLHHMMTSAVMRKEKVSKMEEHIRKQDAIDAIYGDGPPEPHYPDWYAQRIRELPAVDQNIPEPVTIRDKLNNMSDEEFAEWLCHQMWPDYEEDDVINVVRYNSVRNFLKMRIDEAAGGEGKESDDLCEVQEADRNCT